MAAPLVSLIVPTRNRRARLRQAVASILAQTYPRLEVLVINDGGQDVAPVLDRFGDPRVRGLRLSRPGERCRARNLGLELARGAYIGYLDDDDRLDPEHIAVCVAGLEKGADVVYTAARRAVEERRGKRWRVTRRETAYAEPFDARRLLLENYIPILAVMHRASCLDKVAPFDPDVPRTEDWDFWIRLSREYPFVFLERETCEFSWRDAGTSMSGRQEPFAWAALNMFYKYAKYFRNDAEVAQKHHSVIVGGLAILCRALDAWTGPASHCAREIFAVEDLETVMRRSRWLLWRYPGLRRGFHHLLARLERLSGKTQLAQARLLAWPEPQPPTEAGVEGP